MIFNYINFLHIVFIRKSLVLVVFSCSGYDFIVTWSKQVFFGVKSLKFRFATGLKIASFKGIWISASCCKLADAGTDIRIESRNSSLISSKQHLGHGIEPQTSWWIVSTLAGQNIEERGDRMDWDGIVLETRIRTQTDGFYIKQTLRSLMVFNR